MSITFAPLNNADVTATAAGALRLAGLATAFDMDAGTAQAVGALGFTGEGFAEQQGGAPIVEPPSMAYGVLGFAGEAFATYDEHTEAEAYDALRLAGEAFASGSLPAGSTDAFASGSPQLYGYALEEPDQYGWGYFVERPGILTASGNAYEVRVFDGLALSDDPLGDYAVAIREVVRLTDAPLFTASFLRTVEASVVLRDFAISVFEREVLSDLDLSDEFDQLLQSIVTVADQLLLADENQTVLSTLSTVVAALALRDAVRAVLQGEVPAEVELEDLVESRLQAIVEAAAQLMLDDEFAPNLVLFSLVEDGFAIADETSAGLSALVEALAAMQLGVRLRIGDEMFVGYAMNVRNSAVSQYENYPFNSMAVVGGIPYGAGEGGIFRLEGDDDAGAPINASLRTGAAAFEYLARAPYARLVYTSDGQLLLRTITMDSGRRQEMTYRMKQRPLGTPVESRVDMAKGTTGSVWAFELVNEDGAYFEVDALQVWVMQLSRRYSGR